MNGEVLTAIIGLSLNSLAWPVLFAFRRVSFTAWPKAPEAPQNVPAAAETGQPAAGAQSPSGTVQAPRVQPRQGL